MQPPELPRTNHTPDHMAGTHRDQADQQLPVKFCSACGQPIEPGARHCPNCGAAQNLSAEQLYKTKNKWIAAVLAITLGGFGDVEGNHFTERHGSDGVTRQLKG